MYSSQSLPTRFVHVEWIKRGRVFTAFDSEHKFHCCVKRFNISTSAYNSAYMRQVSLYKLFSQHEIAPKFLFSMVTSQYGYIATELWHGTLKSEDILTPTQLLKLQTKVTQMHELGWLHNDLHDQNILKKVHDVALIDFDMATTFSEAREIIIPHLLPSSLVTKYNNKPELLDIKIIEDICIKHTHPH